MTAARWGAAAWCGLFLILAAPVEAQRSAVSGVWSVDRYILRDGTEHPLSGRIFFGEREWTVLYFVLDSTGRPVRGSAEGGPYRLRGDSLTFTHRHLLAVGDSMPGLPAAPLRMVARASGELLPEEPASFEVDGPRLTILFPSGNVIEFSRLTDPGQHP